MGIPPQYTESLASKLINSASESIIRLMLFLYGDESKNISDPFWGIGVIYTNDPNSHMQQLRKIRSQCDFLRTEMKYSSTDYSQVLPAIRTIDYLFNALNLYFKIIIKDKEFFDISYFEDNIYSIDKWHLAYLTNYRNLCRSIKPESHNSSKMILNYDQKSFVISGKMKEFLQTQVPSLVEANPKDSKEKLRNGEFTDMALMIQLADLFTGIITSFLYPDDDQSNKFKKIYRKALLSHCPGLIRALRGKTHFYHPSWSDQKISIFYSNKLMPKKNAS